MAMSGLGFKSRSATALQRNLRLLGSRTRRFWDSSDANKRER